MPQPIGSLCTAASGAHSLALTLPLPIGEAEWGDKQCTMYRRERESRAPLCRLTGLWQLLSRKTDFRFHFATNKLSGLNVPKQMIAVGASSFTV